MKAIGFDIGGANVKAADSDGTCHSVPFAVWKEPEGLVDVLRELLARFAGFKSVAVTMTAELADCFATKVEGVDRILSAVESSVRSADSSSTIAVWQTGAEFVDVETAREIPFLVAAANWHALATWCGRIAPIGTALLIDIGSTTTDIIPLDNGVPVARGMTDRERLVAGELVYSGVRRTPLCALAHAAPIGEETCPVAAELFATTIDVYLLTGDVQEDVTSTDTANGQPATRRAAHDRMARMLCCDANEIDFDASVGIAEFFANVHEQRILGALNKVLAAMHVGSGNEIEHVIVSGSGSFLAERVVARHARVAAAPRTFLREMLSPAAAESACALAVATLAAERL